jgi:hypothetical protein
VTAYVLRSSERAYSPAPSENCIRGWEARVLEVLNGARKGVVLIGDAGRCGLPVAASSSTTSTLVSGYVHLSGMKKLACYPHALYSLA